MRTGVVGGGRDSGSSGSRGSSGAGGGGLLAEVANIAEAQKAARHPTEKEALEGQLEGNAFIRRPMMAIDSGQEVTRAGI